MSIIEQLANEQYISLETFRKNGQAVATPVWLVRDDDALATTTPHTTAKLKRLAHTKRVRVAACDARGTVSGSWYEGEAEVLDPAESKRIVDLHRKRYGFGHLMISLFGKLRGWRTVAIRIRLSEKEGT